jgi:hypothetical protein
MPWKYRAGLMLTAKDLRAGTVGKTDKIDRNLLAIYYQNLRVGPKDDLWGISLFPWTGVNAHL